MPLACEIDIQIAANPVDWHPLAIPAASGAEAAFLGRTRAEDHPNLGPLIHLDYECHRSLAEAALRNLAREAADQFDCHAIRVHHAIGPVAIGEASVLIQAVTGHRRQAFDATRYLIDELKTRVPIWKREVWERGSSWSDGAAVATGLKGLQS